MKKKQVSKKIVFRKKLLFITLSVYQSLFTKNINYIRISISSIKQINTYRSKKYSKENEKQNEKANVVHI